jgi:hypothetical protein
MPVGIRLQPLRHRLNAAPDAGRAAKANRPEKR